MKTIVIQIDRKRVHQHLIVSVLHSLFPDCDIHVTTGRETIDQGVKKDDENINDR